MGAAALGQREALRNSSGSIGRLPSRCASVISTAPVPQAMVSPPSTAPGAPWPSASRQRSSFTRSPFSSVQAPGKGERPRICRSISVAGRVQSIPASALAIFSA